MLLFGGFNLLK